MTHVHEFRRVGRGYPATWTARGILWSAAVMCVFAACQGSDDATEASTHEYGYVDDPDPDPSGGRIRTHRPKMMRRAASQPMVGKHQELDTSVAGFAEIEANDDSSLFDIFQLNGLGVHPTYIGGSMDGGAVSLADNEYFELPSSLATDFGGDDFVVEVSLQVTSFPDPPWGTVFQRFSTASPGAKGQDGLMAKIKNDGSIMFAQTNTDTPSHTALCAAGTVSDWTRWHELKFRRTLNAATGATHLSVSADGTACGEYVLHTQPQLSTFQGAALRFSANYIAPKSENLVSKWRRISLLQASFIELDGVTISPVFSGGAFKAAVTSFADDQYMTIPAAIVGSLGSGDFEIDMSVKLTNLPNAPWGSLFQRFPPSGSQQHGLLARVSSDGAVEFAQTWGNHDYDKALCPPGSVNNWFNWHRFRFIRKNNVLSIVKDRVTCGTFQMTKIPVLSVFQDSPMIFAGKFNRPTDQSIVGEMRQIRMNSYDPRLIAYVDQDGCGPLGANFNAGWCGGVDRRRRAGGTNCTKEVTVTAALCPSLIATPARVLGDGQFNTKIHLCSYAFHAQYRCIPPDAISG